MVSVLQVSACTVLAPVETVKVPVVTAKLLVMVAEPRVANPVVARVPVMA